MNPRLSRLVVHSEWLQKKATTVDKHAEVARRMQTDTSSEWMPPNLWSVERHVTAGRRCSGHSWCRLEFIDSVLRGWSPLVGIKSSVHPFPLKTDFSLQSLCVFSERWLYAAHLHGGVFCLTLRNLGDLQISLRYTEPCVWLFPARIAMGFKITKLMPDSLPEGCV